MNQRNFTHTPIDNLLYQNYLENHPVAINPVLEEDLRSILNDQAIDWAAFAGKTVLVSGASGFLPSYMVQTLIYLNRQKKQKPTTVLGLVRDLKKAEKKYRPFLNDPHLVLLEQDISSPFSVEQEVDYIIHAASQASPKYFLSDPVGTINANTLGTTNLLKIAKEKKTKSFLYFSTGEVNGDIFDHKDVVFENDYGVVNPLTVRSCYPESKRMGENMCICWMHQYEIPVKIVRPSHTYGPGFSLDDGRAFASFVASAVKGENIILNSDGSATRSFCYLTDAARAYFLVLLKGQNGEAYNIANAYEISILEMAQTIVSLCPEKKLHVEFLTNNDSASSKIKGGSMSIKKIKALGWEPKITEQEGFGRTIRYFEKEVL